MDYFFAGLLGYLIGAASVLIAALIYDKVTNKTVKNEAEEDDYIIGCEPLDGGDDFG